MSCISLNISSAIRSVTSDQIAMTLFRRSPFVIAPSRYWPSTLITSFRASSTSLAFSCGMIRSSTPIEIPDRVA
jgi:hypothetical protein